MLLFSQVCFEKTRLFVRICGHRVEVECLIWWGFSSDLFSSNSACQECFRLRLHKLFENITPKSWQLQNRIGFCIWAISLGNIIVDNQYWSIMLVSAFLQLVGISINISRSRFFFFIKCNILTVQLPCSHAFGVPGQTVRYGGVSLIPTEWETTWDQHRLKTIL